MRSSFIRQKGHCHPSVRLATVTLALTGIVIGIATPAVASTQATSTSTQATSTSAEATSNWQMRGTALLIVQVRLRRSPTPGADAGPSVASV